MEGESRNLNLGIMTGKGRKLADMGRMHKSRNEYIRGTAHVERFKDKVTKEKLRWFGHVHRWDGG